MGKGGYLGGSTLLYINKKDSLLPQEIVNFPERSFQCPICSQNFSYTEYFKHLNDVHELKGCIICGHAYKYNGEEKHTCVKCGKFIRLKGFGKNKNKITTRKSSPNLNSNNNDTISSSKCLDSENTPNVNLNATICNQKSVCVKKSNSTNKSACKKNEKFGVSIKDILIQAFIDRNDK